MLSFKIKQSGVLQVYLDEQGLQSLIRGIDNARRHGHTHLCTPSGGGNELDEKTPFGEDPIGEVIIDWEGDNGS
jgi:hypothetical protein